MLGIGSSEGSSLIVWLILGALYFVPTIISNVRQHHNSSAIFALNLLIGWTFIGWVGALVWACTAVNHKVKNPAQRTGL